MATTNYPIGDFYPKNLFDRIKQVTRGGGDPIGDAVIRSAFRNPDGFNISCNDINLVESKSSRTQKYLTVLSNPIFPLEETEVSEKLRAAHETMSPELKQRFPDALSYLQKSLNLGEYVTVSDLPRKTAGILKLFTELRLNEAVFYLMKKAFDISPPAFTENILIGYGYDVLKDRPLPTSPFKMGELQSSDIIYKFPSFITCSVDFQSKDILHFFKNREEYFVARTKRLSVRENTLQAGSFTGATRPGYNVLNEITSPGGNLIAPITAVREFRTFELVLSDEFVLTNEFKAAVRSLTPYNTSDYESVFQWKSFFGKYGTHVVKSVYGGGAIQIELKSNEKFSPQIAGLPMSFIQFAEDISHGKFGNSSFDALQDVQHALKFVGGDKKQHTMDLRKFPLQEAADLLENWKESLALSPTILTSEMRLLSISEITRGLGQNISSKI